MTRLLSWLSPRRLLQSLVISAVAAAVTGLAALAISYLFFPVTGMEVQGARMFPRSEAWNAVPSYASLLFLNTNALERDIETNPWVKGAVVLKDWESGIVTVEVEERRAVLDGDLRGRRAVVSADGTELPGLGGAGLNRVELDEAQLEEIVKVGEVFEENYIVLDSVDEVDARGIAATVEGQRVLFASTVGSGQARALERLFVENPEAPYFDLRSPERVVVGAKPGGDSEASSGAGLGG